MSSKINVKTFIEEYTNGKNMIIPLIQRNYKWNKGNKDKEGNLIDGKSRGIRSTAHNLIWEIIDNYKNHKSMNLGIIVLYDEKNSEEECHTKRLILDGQQRMITLSLIVRFLANKLNKKMQNEWFTFLFERDFDEQNGIRYNYMFNSTDLLKNSSTSVDIKRMSDNTEEIIAVVEALKFEKFEELLKYIKNKVYFIVRVTNTPPLDEFLNVNSNKTPFSICDFIKIFLLKDILEDTAIDDGERYKRKEEVLFLYSEIASYLYKRKGQENNELYEMISTGYSNIINHPEINRMDLIFEDKYYANENVIKPRWKNMFGKNVLIKLEQSEILDKYENVEEGYSSSYEQTIARLRYFKNVLKGIDEELYTKDKNNSEHINSNAFNTFYVINRYMKKTFFSLFSEEDIRKEVDPNSVIKAFCLQEFCAEQTKKLKNRMASNEFIESVMQTEIKKEKNVCSSFKIEDKCSFDDISGLFFECYDEYTNLIKYGKQKNTAKKEEIVENIVPTSDESSSTINNQCYSIKGLYCEIDKIIIPDIQRDFIKGCSAKDFLEDIVSKISILIVDKYIENAMINYGELAKKIYYYYNKTDNTIIPEQEKSRYEQYAKEMLRNMMIATLSGKKLEWDRADDIRRTLSYLVKKTNIALSNVSEYCTQKRIKAMKNNATLIAIYNLNILKNRLDLTVGEVYTASCIVGFLDNKQLFLYDGQQRLSTFLCAIGYLKRKLENVPDEINNLWEKFQYSGRSKANEAIKYLYTSKQDDDELLKEILKYVCDQTTESIYMITDTLMKMQKDGVYVTYKYFYDWMNVEFYGIDDKNETTQLFMDLNDGLPLNPSEIYKAEFSHYISENIDGNRDSVTKIQKYLDNDFVNLFSDKNEPEIDEVNYLKELLEITLIERCNDFRLGEMPELSKLRDMITDGEVLSKLCMYIEKFICYYKDDSNSNKNKTIKEFCNSVYYYKINKAKYAGDDMVREVYCEYCYQEDTEGRIKIFANYKTIEDHYKDKYCSDIPFDLKIKINYSLSNDGFIKTDNSFFTDYLLNDDNNKKNIDDLLQQMAQKKYRDVKSCNQFAYQPNEIKNVEIALSSAENVNSVFDEIMLSENTSLETIENMFYGDTIKIDLKAVSQKIKKKLSNASNTNSNIYKALYNNFDIVSYENGTTCDTIIWNGDSYEFWRSEKEIYGLTLQPPKEDVIKNKSLKSSDEAMKIYTNICNNRHLNNKNNEGITQRAQLLYWFANTKCLTEFINSLIDKECLQVNTEDDVTEYIFTKNNSKKKIVLKHNSGAWTVTKDEMCEG